MSFMTRRSLARCRGLSVVVLSVSMPLAHAAPVIWSSGKVDIAFDSDTFSFGVDVPSFGSIVRTPVLPSSLDYSLTGDGVTIDFNDQLSLYASSYGDFNPQTLTGEALASFGFTARPGYTITGYTITWQGSYSIETPGSVDLTAPGGGYSQTAGGIGPFTITEHIAGAVAPSIQGAFSAVGDVTTVQVIDGYEQVFSHYEQVLDYCEPDDPSVCYYRDEAVYVDVPIYRDETDLGEAQINISSVSIQAQVAAVPEPSTVMLTAAGAGLLAWRARRRVAAVLT